MFYKGSLKLIPGQEYDSLVKPIQEIAEAGYTVTLNFRFGRYSLMDWGYSDAWAKEYQSWYNQIGDPVVQWALYNTGKIRWSELGTKDPLGVLTKAKRHGIKFGTAHCMAAGPGRSLLSAANSTREFTDAEVRQLDRSFQQIVNRVARGAFLTDKEIEVLRALASGVRQTELADELGLTKGAIAARVKKAMHSLDCSTLNHAIAVATKWGYLDGPDQALH